MCFVQRICKRTEHRQRQKQSIFQLFSMCVTIAFVLPRRACCSPRPAFAAVSHSQSDIMSRACGTEIAARCSEIDAEHPFHAHLAMRLRATPSRCRLRCANCDYRRVGRDEASLLVCDLMRFPLFRLAHVSAVSCHVCSVIFPRKENYSRSLETTGARLYTSCHVSRCTCSGFFFLVS